MERWVAPGLALVGYVSLVTVFVGSLKRDPKRWGWPRLLLMFPLAAIAQWAWLDASIPGWGIERWPASLYFESSSGYFSIARRIPDQREFLHRYDEWIKTQDVFHIGTHPPGMIALNQYLLTLFKRHPEAARRIVERSPSRFHRGSAIVLQKDRLSLEEQGALTAMASITFLLGVSTMLPLYGLGRTGLSASGAFLAAASWPMVPAPLLFLPVSDCLFPLMSVASVGLIVAGARSARWSWLALLGGVLIVAGLLFSLAFLTVLALGIGAVLVLPGSRSWRREKACSLGYLAVGILAPIAWMEWGEGIHLLSIWRTNLGKHSGFYQAMPRSPMFWRWESIVEFAVACGPTGFLLASATLAVASWKRSFRVIELVLFAWVGVLVVLDLSGRNLGEVARLWILLTPFSCLGMGWWGERAPVGVKSIALWLLLQGAVCLVLLTRVEPLLPVALSS